MKKKKERLTLFFKALADETRLRILENLREDEFSVSDLVDRLQLAQPLVSHHLKELKIAGLVSSRKLGPYVFYRLRYPEVFKIIEEAQKIMGEEE